MKKVITYGTFDLLHEGHIKLLKRAKKLGDYLIVGVTSESYDKYRGKLNVKQSLIERIENIKATGLADKIVVEEYEGQKIDDICNMQVDIFVIGSDWLGKFDYLREYCEVVYLERTKGISSTELRNREMPILQCGIVGNGRIAGRFVTESKFVSGITVNGVYGIHSSSVERFAKDNQLEFYTTDWEAFLKKITTVYIAAPHGTHYEYAKKAILAGKHVLCEKPLCFEKKQAEELYALAEANHVILMEAVKTAYCPAYKRLVSYAKSGKIGQIVNVEATFTKLVSSKMREMNPKMDGGSFFELGTYVLLPILDLLGDDYGEINFLSRKGNTSVDIFTKVQFVYDGAIADGNVGLGVKSEGSLVISGTRGYIYVPSPWWKTEYFEIKFENQNETDKHFYKFLGDGLRYEIVEFIKSIKNKVVDENRKHKTIKSAEIMEEFRNKNENVRFF